jgi:hypothetical protein
MEPATSDSPPATRNEAAMNLLPKDGYPLAQLEQMLIAEYLRAHGCDPEAVHTLPKAQVERLMVEASVYASAKLSEVEARAHLVAELHGPAAEGTPTK